MKHICFILYWSLRIIIYLFNLGDHYFKLLYSFFIELHEIRLEILYLKRVTIKVFSSLSYKMDYRTCTICFILERCRNFRAQLSPYQRSHTRFTASMILNILFNDRHVESRWYILYRSHTNEVIANMLQSLQIVGSHLCVNNFFIKFSDPIYGRKLWRLRFLSKKRVFFHLFFIDILLIKFHWYLLLFLILAKGHKSFNVLQWKVVTLIEFSWEKF